jgi:DNA-binding NarL/FixJ family response regulator
VTPISLLTKNSSEHFRASLQANSLGNSSVNHAFTYVAREVAGLLQKDYSTQAEHSNFAETVAIRAIEPEYRRLITTESLTRRELEVLRLIADGYSNSVIAQRLHITMGTVKSHVRNILRKLYATDRTQAAIRALRSGLVH